MQTRVIIADDEAIQRMDLKDVLAKQGYLVIGEAGDGQSAVNLARELRPDLVIMDIRMPDMDGITAAETLTQEKVAPVLLLTAFGDQHVSKNLPVPARQGRPASLLYLFRKNAGMSITSPGGALRVPRGRSSALGSMRRMGRCWRESAAGRWAGCASGSGTGRRACGTGGINSSISSASSSRS